LLDFYFSNILYMSRPKRKHAPTKRRKLDDLEGDGLFDYFKPRDSYNNTSRTTLSQLGGFPIVSITLSRAPIQSMLRKALDVVSFGSFSKLTAKYGFDKLFHLSMLVDVDANGSRRRVVVEKNAVINISTRFKAESDAEYLPIALRGSLTLDQMMGNTQKLMGARFFPYNAFSNNCQVFIRDVLKANGLLTSQAQSWLFQNVEKLAEELPEVSKVITNAVTHTGAVVDNLVGNGTQSDGIESLIQESISRVLSRGGVSPIAPLKFN
jgi:hypothetical protein